MKNLVATFLSIWLVGCGIASGQFRKQYEKTSTSFSFQKDLYMGQVPHGKSKAFHKAIAVPLLLTAAGLYTQMDTESSFNKYEVREERNEYLPDFHTHVDDYLQYAPIAAVYGLNLAGVKGKNDFANRTALLIKSEILVGVLTYTIKNVTAVQRPDSSSPNSFPSGHTAQAFAAATFMAKEYGHKNVWYSIGAYTVATSVGVMRVMNNRHWITDVLVGAGVGIFSTNMAYLTHQYKWGKKHKKAGQTTVIPSYDGRSGMVSMVYQFH